MKKIFHNLLCFFGFHEKHTLTRTGVVNCVQLSIEITECKNCKKVL